MKVFKGAVLAVAVAATFSANATITEISTDKFHTLFIDKTTKEVAVIGGSDMFNEAGDYAVYGQNTPVPYGVGNAVSVVAAGFRSYVLKFDGTVWGSGRELGKTPVQLPLYDVSDIAATGESVLFLVDGTVYEYNIATGVETQVEGLPTNIAEVSADYYHCAVRTVDGDVYTWGHNSHGQLGDGSTTDNPSASLIDSVPQIVHISTSRGNTVLTDINGDVWTIGDGLSGRAGNGTDDDEVVPYQLPIENPEQVLKAFAGYTQTLVLFKDGQVKMVGWHNFIGNDVDGNRIYNRDYELITVPELSDVATLDATGDHKIFIKNDGTKVGWGAGGNGQLGNGKNVETHYPELVQDVEFPDDYIVEYQAPLVQECPIVEPEIVEIEVEVPVETIQYVEVIKEVEVVQYVDVPVDVIKYVNVPVETIQYVEVIKEVEVVQYVDVPVDVIKYVEVIKEVEVVKYVDVPVETIKEVIKTVYVEVPVVEYVEVGNADEHGKGHKNHEHGKGRKGHKNHEHGKGRKGHKNHEHGKGRKNHKGHKNHEHADNGHGNDKNRHDYSNPGKKYKS